MSLSLGECISMPLWVKLKGVPIQFWNKVGLSYIASVLGKPLHMDVTTMNRHALMFARVCIDMSASSSFPESVTLELEDGSTTSIEVEYPWRPAACALCKVFDHSNRSCPKVSRREWMPRPVVMAQRKPEDAEGWITVKRKDSCAVEDIASPPVVEGATGPVTVGDVPQGLQPPKTPVKATNDNPSTSKEAGKKIGEAERCIEHSSPCKLQPGSSSGTKKRKKKGHSGQWGLVLAGPNDGCCHLECEGLE
ncbi:DUF4283 domain-containing protein/zf-CCHC_4 domain-containing protein [Cephalotus follicularis]|uniref:DUF4283 domain-containing protein/zf-CCHC_4 domain-containing protein n=1 Tax=Cephalotus follicularis TaxID=3775 RepID=A0A1Q3B340_CEPFO|nr:DUF4283 domain-containing protein/zf-CCHC_4 domain-containing protein [Cephalotus follicularis]